MATEDLECHTFDERESVYAGARTSRQPEDARAAVSCIICTTPRSGSWLLADQLLLTGVAGRPEEYFRLDWYERFLATGQVRYRHMKSHRGVIGETTADNEASISTSRSFPDFVAAVRRLGSTRNGVFAMKIHWRQLARILPSLRAHRSDAPDSDAALLEAWFPNAHYVFLRRADKVRQAISFHRALRTSVWWSLADETRRVAPSDDIDLDDVDRLRCDLELQETHWRRFLAQSSRPALHLTYEQLAQRPRATTAQVLRFLERDPARAKRLPAPRLRRQADRRTPRLVFDYWVKRRSGAFRRSLADPHHDATRTTMRTGIIVVENFFADPAAIREYALRQTYYYPYGTIANAHGMRRPIWMASRFKRATECPLKSSQRLIDDLEEITGEEIDLDFWRADFPVDLDGLPSPDHRLDARRGSLWNCCFHCKPDTSEQLGTGIHNHVDDTWNQVGPHGWSGVVYLNRDGEAPSSSGLKLWRNRDASRNADWMTPQHEWEVVDSLGNVSNRLILYRGNLPHTGSPGWGSGLRSGRLCMTFFFKPLAPVHRQPLTVNL